MKTTLSFPRVALLALALATASVTATFAQTTATTTAPTCSAGGHHHHDSILTAAEKAQLKKAHEEALAANGTLQTEQASLKQQFETIKTEGATATQAEWQTLHQQKHDFKAKLRAAELTLDPTLAPIFTKLDAAHQHGHHHSDASPTPSST